MTAYLFVDLDIHDEEGFQEHRTKVPALIAMNGGEYLMRGGKSEVIAGDFVPHRLGLFRFPNMQSIKNHFADPAYVELTKIRNRTSKSTIIAMEALE